MLKVFSTSYFNSGEFVQLIKLLIIILNLFYVTGWRKKGKMGDCRIFISMFLTSCQKFKETTMIVSFFFSFPHAHDSHTLYFDTQRFCLVASQTNQEKKVAAHSINGQEPPRDHTVFGILSTAGQLQHCVSINFSCQEFRFFYIPILQSKSINLLNVPFMIHRQCSTTFPVIFGICTRRTSHVKLY